ncbi:MAG: hypothetical protein WKF40_01190 [Thermoleophilaceae bacterium]
MQLVRPATSRLRAVRTSRDRPVRRAALRSWSSMPRRGVAAERPPTSEDDQLRSLDAIHVAAALSLGG